MDEKTSLKMIGAAAGKQRINKDFYPTPPEVTKSLLGFLDIPKDKKIWEPACGEMDMANVFSEMGYSCVSSDIKDGCDFLETELKECDWIITNPPFYASADFIKRCAEFNKPFALLLKSQYWHSSKRFELTFYRSEIVHLEYPNFVCAVYDRFDE